MSTAPSISDACFEYLLSTWLDTFGLVSHQIASYDKFLETKVQEIINESSQVIAENEKTGAYLSIKFLKVYIRTPSIKEADGANHRLTPHECRLRGLSYNVSVYVNVMYESRENSKSPMKTQEYCEVNLCKIPCMVGSLGCSLRHGDRGECDFDTGGYFIVNGNEKGVNTIL